MYATNGSNFDGINRAASLTFVDEYIVLECLCELAEEGEKEQIEEEEVRSTAA